MERSKAKEAGRKKTIREKANALKDKPPRKAPAKEAIKQAGRYHTIETAKKQLSEAQQAIAPDQEQQPYTAVDKVETYTANAAHELLQSLPTTAKNKQRSDNPFHGETDSGTAPKNYKPAPKDRMRREAVKEFKQRRTEEQREAINPAVSEKADCIAKRRGINATAQKNTIEHRSATSKASPSVQTTGQRHAALPRNAASPVSLKKQIVKEQGRRLARNQAIWEIQTGTASNLSGRAAKASGDFFKKLGVAVTKAVTPSKEMLLYAASALVLILIPFMAIIGLTSILSGSGDGHSEAAPLSAEVEAYRPMIRLYAAQHGIPEYDDLIAAVMMQESCGQGTDPMQASESGYNTRYPHAPNSITDPEYSIDVGVHTLADVLNMAAVENPIDLDRISLALQGYNFGPGYISWALANYGGYSELNAIEFSDMMAAQYGWAGYGDKAYVSHVLRYYPVGRTFMGEGNTAMVAVAQSQIGNVGGEPYWRWWGLDYRVEWCAMFVSWCADQCGYLDAGVLPKMEGVRPYVDWFIERGQWQGRDYKPIPGDIIFFDWESDGLADHIGIVEKVENGIVFTIEGNSNDSCGERFYAIKSDSIYGYGIIE